MKSLNKVYIQDLNPADIADRFGSIRSDIDRNSLVMVKDVEQFFLPPEL